MLSSLLLAALCTPALLQAGAPEPYGALPSPRQLAWHGQEFYGFVHLTINTFTDREWGYGDEDPALFAPTDLDADQIVGAMAAAGMTRVIVTAKHHDGFCLWDSAHTEHDVARSGYEGDVVRAFADACRRHGLGLGLYLSPWDRNHPEYGRPAYVEYFRAQLRELLTGYGEVEEVWFDGANGGDGYYGGANETRTIDRAAYYGWEETYALVRELQPGACTFGDGGTDIRWVGNERGIAGDPCWSTHTPRVRAGETGIAPGTVQHELNVNGTRGGERWLPAECDVSIRPGWFYHADQNDSVKGPEELLELYYQSVGRGATLLLNVPPDRRGQLHELDVAALRGFGELHAATFDQDLARDAQVQASSERGEAFCARNLVDGERGTYWSTPDDVLEPAVELRFDSERTFTTVSLREFLPLGQRVEGWALDAHALDVHAAGGTQVWSEFAAGTGIGNRRLVRVEPITTTRVRLRITASPVAPALSEFALHCEPARVNLARSSPVFLEEGSVRLSASLPGWSVAYTLDGSPPGLDAPRAQGALAIERDVVLRAVALRGDVLSPRRATFPLEVHRRADVLAPLAAPAAGLAAGVEVEEYAMGWQTLEDLDERVPSGRHRASELTIDGRPRDEHIALSLRALLEVPEDGLYLFATASDDGSRLWIGERLVVDNDGLHGSVERRGTIGLRAGLHPLRVAWFNATGGLGLSVRWARLAQGSAALTPIPARRLFRPLD